MGNVKAQTDELCHHNVCFSVFVNGVQIFLLYITAG